MAGMNPGFAAFLAKKKGGTAPAPLAGAAARRLAVHKGKPKGKVKPNPKAPVGQGGRFAALQKKLGTQPGVTDPKALAAAIGRRKYGASKFAAMGKK